MELNDLEWLPNRNIEAIIGIVSNDFDKNLQVIMDSSRAALLPDGLKAELSTPYHSIKPYVRDIKDDTFKYPLIHSTPKTGIKMKYSSTCDKGHFGIKKIIFGEAGLNHVIIDLKGEYGMTQGAIGIKVKNIKEAETLKTALLSDKFNTILKSCI